MPTVSEHTIHVPPRQTVHATAMLDLQEEAHSVVLTRVEWHECFPAGFALKPREVLHLSVCPHDLDSKKTSLDFEPTKKPRVMVGNWSDYPIAVSFEIWGKP